MSNLLIEQYKKFAIDHENALLKGDSKTGNKLHSKLSKLIVEINNGSLDSKSLFFQLMYHENDSVKLWTATKLLKSFEQKALDVLEKIKIENTGISGLTAIAIIDSWKKSLITNLLDWGNKAST